jgi:hypothetical protein
MAAKKPLAPSNVYTLKITLAGIRPPIWRRLVVGDNVTLLKLHKIIQAVMGWEDYHLHQFEIGGDTYGEPQVEGFRTIKDERRFALGQVVTGIKTKFKYVYDFGDDWQHEVVVEEIAPYQEGQLAPACLKGKRAAPPEDIGGPWGYYALLEAKDNPRHPEYDNFRELIGAYDPEAFNLDAVNDALGKLR